MQTDNKTLYGIKEAGERSILITWSVIVVALSLIGDSLILLGTIRYRAIKQHKVILAVIQHMAVCDLLQTIFRVIPSTLSFITDKWVLGTFLCHTQNHVLFICSGVTMFLTCTMSTVKLLILKRPLRAAHWSSTVGQLICAGVWVFLLLLYTPTLVVALHHVPDTLHFSYRNYDCDYDLSSPLVPAWFSWYGLIGYIAGTIIPLIVLAVTSLLVLVVARRAVGRDLQWEGVMIVLVTVGVFFISYLPSGVVIVVGRLGMKCGTVTRRAILYLNYLNIVSNFLVYCLTVRSFRQWLRETVCQVFSLGGGRRGGYLERKSDLRGRVETQTEETQTQTVQKQACEPFLEPAVKLDVLHKEEEEDQKSIQDTLL